MTNVSRTLADFIAGLKPGTFDDALIREAKRSILNHLSAAFGGCREPEISAAAKILSDGTGSCPVIGRKERLRPLDAAFLNAALANVQDFDDTHLATVIHPAAPVAPALFALAEMRPMTGRALTEAFAVGVEVACRTGMAATPAHYRGGYHITSTCGVMGAAAAVGFALRFDADKLVDALGVAANQSAGLVGSLGRMSKCASVGNAARNGLFSALMAEEGVKGPPDPYGGPHGFFATMCREPEPNQLVDDLGSRWEALRNTYKPYPAGIVVHSVIDACLGLVEQHNIAAADVVAVDVTGHPLLLERTDRPDVATGRESQVSLQHAVAVSILHRAAGLKEFSDAGVADPAAVALRKRVKAHEDAAMIVGAAQVVITTKNGDRHGAMVEHARGSEARPLTDGEITEKLRVQADGKSPRASIEEISRTVLALDTLPDAKVVYEMAASVG